MNKAVDTGRHNAARMEQLEQLQCIANRILLAAAVCKAICGIAGMVAMIPGLGDSGGGIARVEFVSGVLVLLYMAIEVFLLRPAGIAVLSVMIGIVFIGLTLGVQLIIEIFMEIIVLSVLFSVGTFVFGFWALHEMFFVLALLDVNIVGIATGPAALFAEIGAGVVGAGGVAGYGAGRLIDRTSKRNARRGTGRAAAMLLANLVVLVGFSWPVLSATQAISGVIACKPAVIVSQAFMNYMNVEDSKYSAIFENESRWVFKNHFYDKYINDGQNNNLTQGGKNMIAGNAMAVAFLIDDVLEVHYVNMEEYNAAAYIPRKTDALILGGDIAFVFGRDKVFVCGEDGKYTWKQTSWTSEFEALSQEEQYERIYDILERQNTDEEVRFSYDEVGVVAYAQRNGLLLGYNDDTHTAFLASTDDDGNVTVYRQSERGYRETLGSFTPLDTDGNGLGYYLLVDKNGLIYLDEREVRVINPDTFEETVLFSNPDSMAEDASFRTLVYADNGDEGQYLFYMDDQGYVWVDRRFLGIMDCVRAEIHGQDAKASGSAGNYCYNFWYKDSLLSRLTYWGDLRKAFEPDSGINIGRYITAGWHTIVSYEGIRMRRAAFDPAAAEQERRAEEAYQNSPEVKYAVEIQSRDGRERYDKNYLVAGSYKTYTGPAAEFSFAYPGRFYDDVDYSFENEGADISIVYTCDDDPSYLEVSLHPLPDGVEDLQGYAESWFESELAGLYTGLPRSMVGDVQEYNGQYRFRLEGWTSSGSGVQTEVICCVTSENVMRMVLRYPNGTDDEDSRVKAYYAKYMNYRCGFGVPAKAPSY